MKYSLIKKVGILGVFLVAVLLLVTCSPLWVYSKSVHGYVKDENGEPIQDVIVVAYWKLDGGLEGGINYGMVNVMETVTDKNGYYEFPAWGPKTLPSDSGGRLKREAPGLIFYKENYGGRSFSNPNQKALFMPAASVYTGKTITMTKKEFSEKQTHMVLDAMYKSLRNIIVRDNSLCQWKNFPRMIMATRHDDYNAKSSSNRNLYRKLSLRETELRARGCGGFEQFMENYE